MNDTVNSVMNEETGDSVMVSVIIPVYNGADYLKRAVDSVVRQTFGDWELLLIDDGSRDDTPAICRSLTDPRIHYFPKAHAGVAAARNMGLAMARGKYIYFLDSDDSCEPDMLAEMISLMEEKRADIGIFGYTEHRGEKFFTEFPQLEENRYSWLKAAAAGVNMINYLPTKVIRRELFGSNPFDVTLHRYEDLKLMYRLICKAEGFAVCKESFYHYYRRSDSLTLTVQPESLETFNALVEERSRMILAEYPELKPETELAALNGAIYTWNQLSRQLPARKLKSYDRYAGQIASGRAVYPLLNRRYRLMAELIRHIPYLYAHILYILS